MEYATHSINIAEDSFLKSLISDDIRVNSVHHQIIKQLAPSLKAIAWSQDRVIEALEDRDHPFLLGLQWHPEYTYNYSPA
ncbi:gamma-glutamyl-gamma-aminobutyrate hydrolase family protein, partial [Escherichia coli]|nr:gamma-glutamyl-gamma-aminobutyrate hydrolase family protein [Escherichia coli]